MPYPDEVIELDLFLVLVSEVRAHLVEVLHSLIYDVLILFSVSEQLVQGFLFVVLVQIKGCDFLALDD